MAQIQLKWRPVKFPASLSGWVAFRNYVNNSELMEQICDSRTIYIIRLRRPFSICYPEKESCAMYIGRGDFQKRMTSHLKRWIPSLSKHIPTLEMEVLVCLPRVQKNYEAYKDVEASLIDLFEKRYGSLPLRNKRRERSRRRHNFSKGDLVKAYGLRQGPGHHWAIWPVGSNPLRRVSSSATKH